LPLPLGLPYLQYRSSVVIPCSIYFTIVISIKGFVQKDWLTPIFDRNAVNIPTHDWPLVKWIVPCPRTLGPTFESHREDSHLASLKSQLTGFIVFKRLASFWKIPIVNTT
jgi:hypothetical protein